MFFSDLRNAMESYDAHFMGLALAAAREALNKGEVPVGAVVVSDGSVVGTGYNCREERQNPLCHAELIAIQEGSRALHSWRLERCDMYVTLEPCVMCIGAILQARMRRLIFGCVDIKAGAVESLYRLCEDQRLNHRLPVTGGVLANECSSILSLFFSTLRAQKRNLRETERWPSPVEGA
jgi:tRNA(adenine34) deaminase